MNFDKTVLQIFANYCVAAAESMAHTLMRTAHSAFVKETEDFSCTIMTLEGQTFASPKTLGATWYPGLDFKSVIDMIDSYESGDICMTNDAYSGFVATHTPDIMMWKPVYYNGEMVCFVGGHIHNTDMGGAVPASLSRTLTEIHQEGIRFPPCKIMHAGELDEGLMRMMELNVRAPEQNRGDLQAQIAMLMTGERRILEIIERFGLETFKDGMQAMLDYSEAQARALVRGMPDGEYFFSEFADEDSLNGKPLRIAITLRVQGDALEFDFTGSDPQLNSSLNMPTGGRERHVLALVGLNYILYSLNPEILLNAGMLRVARCILPEGSVVNPLPPAAVGMRSLTCKVVQYATIGVFSQVVPDRLPASPAGGMSIVNVKTMDKDGRNIIAAIGPVGGGAGGDPSSDGADASGAIVAFLRNTPVEINETEVPIRITRYGMVPDSGGPGRYRGGLGTCMEFQVFTPNSMVTARNRDRSRFASWGVLGGKAGTVSRFLRNPGTPQEQDLGVNDLIHCQPGDVIRLEGCGGGGYGSPYEREPEKVLHDVRCGYVSLDNARLQYGVVISGDAIDIEATRQLRATLQSKQASSPDIFGVAMGNVSDAVKRAYNGHYDHGQGRDAFEALWTPERYDVLTRCLTSVSPTWRHFLKIRIFDGMDQRQQAGTCTPGAAIVQELFDKLLDQYPQMNTGS